MQTDYHQAEKESCFQMKTVMQVKSGPTLTTRTTNYPNLGYKN